MTESERQFEKFCASVQWRCVPVATGTSRTPDYDLFIGATRIVTEVKEVTSDPYDSPVPEYQDEHVTVRARTKTIGDQVRDKINKAAPQVKSRSAGIFPTLVVIYDLLDPTLRGNTEPLDFLAAMYGPPQAVLAVPQQHGEVYIKETKFGPGRKTTPRSNTSVSALASLWMDRDGALSLDIYHNVFAKVPLEVGLLAHPHVRQYSVDATKRSFHTWLTVNHEAISTRVEPHAP